MSESPLAPARPTPSDMLGAHIEFVMYRPFQRLPIHMTGSIVAMMERNGETLLQVRPDEINIRTRWISETDFVAYVHVDSPYTAIAAYAAAMEGKYKDYLKITGGMSLNIQRDFWLWAMQERQQLQKKTAA